METTISKAQLLAELNSENADWEALLDEIGEANMTQPEAANGWSIKDVVGHLTAWRRRTVKRLQAALNHQPEPSQFWPAELKDYDEINAWINESNRDRPLADVLSDSREVIQQLLAALEAFSDDEFQELHHYKMLEGEPLSGKLFFAHFHDEHEPDMRAWLKKVRSSR